jgi:cyclic dehypoxanthinyl futalosine synthase
MVIAPPPASGTAPTPLPSTTARVNRDEALALLNDASLFALGIRAETVKNAIHGPTAPIGFVIDRNVNYTNICNVDCMFCAFYRHADDADAYVLSYAQIKQKTQELVDVGGTQLLLQGGVNPDIPFEAYLDIVRNLRRDFPTLTIHAFSPTEIQFMSHLTGQPLAWVLQQLMDAGLSSIPGAGGEVLHDDIRSKVSPKKVDTFGWLEVMEEAHQLGLNTTATMMFGMTEKPHHIVDHLLAIREVQDRALARGKGRFTAFIPWTFQKANTKLEKLPHEATGLEYLRVSALSRIVLDNVANIQASWITQGIKVGQTALCMGANDIGGLLLEENVVTQAGCYPVTKTVDEIVKVIHAMGRDAVHRDTAYNVLKRYPRTLPGPE